MSDIVERLTSPIPVSGFNSAGVLEHWEAEPSALDREAAAEITRLREALAAERDACAKIVDPPKGEPTSPEGRLGKMVREGLAAAIRARTP